MRAKLNKFDHIKKEQDAEKVDTATSERFHFHLGSPDKEETSFSELIDETELARVNLPKLVETFINKLRVSEDGYYQVKKEHKVIQ